MIRVVDDAYDNDWLKIFLDKNNFAGKIIFIKIFLSL